jgi:hypothetical protein
MIAHFFKSCTLVLLVVTLSSCFPRSIVQKSELIATGVYRAQNLEFKCDPARTAIDEGLPLDLGERPLSFGCKATNNNSVMTITIEENPKNPTISFRLLWSIPDPTSGLIITLDSHKATSSSANSDAFVLLGRGYSAGSFDFTWSNFASLTGSFRLEVP